MIGKVTGIVDYLAHDHVLIDTGSVGYIVYCADRTLADMNAGDRVAIYTDLIVREDSQQLFGFLNLGECELHRLLITVQGVGAKASLSILGTLGFDGTIQAIDLGDWSSLKLAHGVGPKIAHRIVHELAGKTSAVIAFAQDTGDQDIVVEDSDGDGHLAGQEVQPGKGVGGSTRAVRAEALSALVNLGYSHSDAGPAVAEALRDNSEPTAESVIHAALRLLSPSLQG